MKGFDSQKGLSLYIHIPFCTRKCSYCAFYSLPSSKWVITPDEYVYFIIEEIRKLSLPHLDSLYIGGGNPGLVSTPDLIRLIDEASEKGRPEEITIEMNPEEVSYEKIEKLSGHVDRISIGVQSLNEKALRILGRNSTRKENIRALEILEKSGVNYNADIMTAIPSMTVADTINDIREVNSYKPSHISFYCLTYEEGTPLYSLLDERDEDYEYDSLQVGWKELRDLGYDHYEVSNFAKGGRYSRHNINYWHLNQYLGLGPGSESSLGYRDIYSAHVEENLSLYLKDPSLRYEHLKKDECSLEYIMVSLRTKWGIDKKELLERFSIDFDSTFSGSLKELDKNWYSNTMESFSLTEEGWMMLDSITLALFMAF